MARLYFNADEYDATDGDGHDGEGQRCYALKYHLDLLLDDVLTHVRLYPAAAMRGTGDFYCVELGFNGNTKLPADEYDKCGARCDSYTPCNGKSGRCKHSRPVYEAVVSQSVLLKRDGKVETFPGEGLLAKVLGTPGIDFAAIVEKAKNDKRTVIEVMEDLVNVLPDNPNG